MGGAEENILVGDLARMIGIHGRTQQVMGRDVPLVYLLVGGLLALLWISGNVAVLRMLVFAFVLYNMYVSYQKSRQAGGGMGGGGGLGGFGGAGSGTGTGSGGNGDDGQNSGGSVYKRR